jgi:hypothetical protein
MGIKNQHFFILLINSRVIFYDLILLLIRHPFFHRWFSSDVSYSISFALSRHRFPARSPHRPIAARPGFLPRACAPQLLTPLSPAAPRRIVRQAKPHAGAPLLILCEPEPEPDTFSASPPTAAAAREPIPVLLPSSPPAAAPRH